MTVNIIGVFDEILKKQYFPLFNDVVRAGFPSPASDYVKERIDLNELLVNHPNSTYLVEVAGYSLKDIGIFPHDILIVDRSVTAKNKDIVIALVEDGFMAKQLTLGDKIILRSHNSDYPDIVIKDNLELFGVVVSVVRRLNV